MRTASLGVFTFSILFVLPVRGEITTVTLPQSMADFALSESTGDIATVCTTTNHAYLFRNTALVGGAAAADGAVRVGDTPVAIGYKKYGDLELFAVVCRTDSHMYMINAKTFELIKKIPLPTAGITSVQSSRNPNDPFLYYNYGSGHGAEVGAVDVRKMTDTGRAFDDSEDCAISADGRFAYRRGPWSPSGFESLAMTSDFSADKPTFTRWFYDHTSSMPYVPDPFGTFTASGSHVFTKGLEQKKATLTIIPQCFFHSKPVLIGYPVQSRTSSRSDTAPVKLMAVSYNTFSTTGIPVELSDLQVDLNHLRRGFGVGAHIIADNLNERVIAAWSDHIALVPLTEFNLPDEPFMVAQVSTKQLTVGQPTAIEITTADPRVEIEFDNLPEGMVETAGGLQWTAKDEHVGTVSVQVTSSFKDIQRIEKLELQVTQPSTSVPFQMTDFLVDESAERAICWSGIPLDNHGRPQRNTGITESQLALVPLGSESELKTKTLPYVIEQALLIDNHIVVLPNPEASRVEVYETKNLNRVKTLLSTSPLTGISARGKHLVLTGRSRIDTYDMSTFRLLSSQASSPASHHASSSPAHLSFKDGVMLDGTFYDFEEKTPKLLVSPQRFLILGGAPDTKLYAGGFLRQHQQLPPSGPPSRSHGNATVAGPIPLGTGGAQISLEKAITRIAIPNSTHTNRNKLELSITVTKDGSRAARIPMHSEVIAGINNNSANLHVANDEVFVGFGDRIYRWSGSQYTQQKPVTQEVVDLHFAPQQTRFDVTEATVELKHLVKGQTKPVEYFWLTRLDGVTLDDQTGVVTIERQPLTKEAESMLTEQFGRIPDASRAVEQLRAYVVGNMEHATKVLSRKPTGIPIAIPVHLKAIDQDGQVAELQYFVLLEVDYNTVVAAIRERAKEAQSARLAMQSQRAATFGSPATPATGSSVEIGALQKRIESLEAKVDLLLRQMSAMAKELDKH